MRDDVNGHDIVLLIGAAQQAAAPIGDAAPELWRRYLGVIFDGLRPGAAHPLPRPAPTDAAFTPAARTAAGNREGIGRESVGRRKGR